MLLLGMTAMLGCSGSSDSDDHTGVELTFTRDVAPILFANCASCHRPGGIGPFSLLTYADVQEHAELVVAMTQAGRMPPWKPEPGYGEFVGERRLGQEDRDLLMRWVMQGKVAGDEADLPPIPEWPIEWQLGEPDVELQLPQEYTLPPGDEDVFRNFVIPWPVDRTRYIKAVELRPSNTRIVHHAVLRVDSTRESRRRDAKDPEPGFTGMTLRGVQGAEGHFVGWVPGQQPFMDTDEFSWPLTSGSDLVLELHMLPGASAEPLQVRLAFYFAENPPSRALTMLRLSSKDQDIPAGQNRYVVNDSWVLPVAVDVVRVYPHAHFLGKEVRGYVTLPDGTREWLIFIKDWDFTWQNNYRLKNPLHLPAGSKLEMEIVYDNSAQNPRNPNRPPIRVFYGERSRDEMGDLHLQVQTATREDADILQQNYADKAIQDEIVGARTMLKADKDDAEARLLLGQLELQRGNVNRAVGQLRAAVRTNPESAQAHYFLARALGHQNRTEEAMESYRRALALEDYAEAHHDFAIALRSVGRSEEAMQHLRDAIRVSPDLIQARMNLGLMLLARNRLDEATDQFRQTIAHTAEFADAHYYLGVALHRAERTEEALESLRAAVRLDPEFRDRIRIELRISDL